jgi:hypothetical protein
VPPLCTLLILLQGWWQRRFWLLLTISRLFAPPQGFTWAFLSGVSEPIGALMGYLVLNGNNDLSFAIVFGLVAGGWGAQRALLSAALLCLGCDVRCCSSCCVHTLRICTAAVPPPLQA